MSISAEAVGGVQPKTRGMDVFVTQGLVVSVALKVHGDNLLLCCCCII